MDPDSHHDLIIRLSVLGLCLMGSAFFSAAEIAFVSLNKIRLRTMIENGVKNSDHIKKICESPQKLLSTVLIGNNFFNISASALATSVAIDFVGDNASTIVLCSIAITIIILIFSEITPKHIASHYADKIVLLVSHPIAICMLLLSPFVFVLNFISDKIIFLFGHDKKNKREPSVTEDDLKTMVDVSQEEGVLEIEEREMINNVVAFGDTCARDVMIPRTDMISINLNTTHDEIARLFKSEGFSRLPVYRKNIDDIIGILNLKDFIFNYLENNFELEKILRKPYFTYESKHTHELFKIMRVRRIPMAIVLDEYGGTAGMITLEDLVEEIVGEIDDEYDEPEQDIELIKDDEYIIDGSTKISDVNEHLNVNLESQDFDSIGGYLIGALGYFPKPREIFETDKLKFMIETVNKNRIEKIRMTIKIKSE